MARKRPKTQFWLILLLINIAAMIYPVAMMVQADSSESRIYALLAALGVVFMLALINWVSTVIAYA